MGNTFELPTGADVYDDIEHAIDVRDEERKQVAAVGRTDSYDIARLEEMDDEEIAEAVLAGNHRSYFSGEPSVVLDQIERDVRFENRRQIERYGELTYPNGTGRPGDQEAAEALKAACKANSPAEDNWRDIAAEEVAEAFAETDPKKLRVELVQAMAVMKAWVKDIDRRAAGDAS